jgi:NAD(P)-dependent dehydrogenase (short-subunit alcohol dehydrogenase family)
MMGKAIEQFGAVDILVNNAGIQFVAPIDEFPVAKWNAILAPNLTASFHTIRSALPAMKAKKWGASSNIAPRTRWSRAPTSPRMSPRSTGSPASRRRSLSRSPPTASR